MFNRDTPLSEVKDELIARSNYCDEIAEYFSDYEGMSYGDAMDRWNDGPSGDSHYNSWIITNLVVLGRDNSTEINDQVMHMMVDKGVAHARLLMLWRVAKNFTNASTEAKLYVANSVKGTLPKMERAEDWSFLGDGGVTIFV